MRLTAGWPKGGRPWYGRLRNRDVWGEIEVPQPLRIDAPDALSAFMLAQRLARFSPEIHPLGDACEVRLALPGTRPCPIPEVLAAVRRWLADEGLEATRVQIDGHPCMVRAGKRTQEGLDQALRRDLAPRGRRMRPPAELRQIAGGAC